MPADPKKQKISLFGWTDGMVLVGAVIIIPVAVYERNWFFLSIGIAIAAAIGLRVWLTKWLETRNEKE